MSWKATLNLIWRLEVFIIIDEKNNIVDQGSVLLPRQTEKVYYHELVTW